MVLLPRVGLLMLVQALHPVESAKASKASLNLGDATLLVLDGATDDGMKLARQLLAKEGTAVNDVVELDDDSKGTPLAAAIHTTVTPNGENCMDLIHALLAHKDTDVNAALTAPDGSTWPPLVLAMKAVAAGVPTGPEIAKVLLAHDKIAVNAMTTSGEEGTTAMASLHMALAAAARGAAGGVELMQALLARSEIDADVAMVAPDGGKTTPLAKLAAMLEGAPNDANLHRAITLLHGKAKPLDDAEKQKLVESVVRKDEL